MEGVIGYVTLFAGNFAPRTWAFCQGQTLSIQTNTALYSILGTVYGGNGTSTFMLPDLRGRTVVGAGQGQGLSPYRLGQTAGAETAQLATNQMPAHVHPVAVVMQLQSGSTANQTAPGGNIFAPESGGGTIYTSAASQNMAPFPASISMAPTGAGAPFATRSPMLGLNYIICMKGVYPARN